MKPDGVIAFLKGTKDGEAEDVDNNKLYHRYEPNVLVKDIPRAQAGRPKIGMAEYVYARDNRRYSASPLQPSLQRANSKLKTRVYYLVSDNILCEMG